jgi:hypothetical protein
MPVDASWNPGVGVVRRQIYAQQIQQYKRVKVSFANTRQAGRMSGPACISRIDWAAYVANGTFV